jgi:type IV pilus assembly protein PilA
MTKQKGFSLIELLIVVAIILIIAAIAIPNLLSARKSANESSAVGSLRTINTGETSYIGKHNGYTCTLTDLGPTPGDNYIDSGLAGATTKATAKSGYYYSKGTCGAALAQPPGIGPGATVISYEWSTEPSNLGVTGNQAFCTDGSAVIWKDINGVGATCLTNAPRVPIG